jgi:uncharacterized protein YqhQ
MAEPFHYGGQAVIEGVMMRGQKAMAVAVRQPDGEVVVHTESLDRGFYRSLWAKRPFIRGVLLLWDTLALGMRALVYSANVAAGQSQVPQEGPAQTLDGLRRPADTGPSADATPTSGRARAEAAAAEAFGGGLMWGTMVVALSFGVGIFFVSPLLLTGLVDRLLPTAALSVLFESVVRIGLFFGYVWLIGRMPDVQRVFAYHGAEHKTINAFEAGEPMQPGRVLPYSVAHPRCGTSFLLFVVLLSILVFALIGRPPLPVRLLSRIVLVPIIAALAYELIRFSARHAQNPAVRLLLAPGMALQALTTREPDAAQVEVAIAALDRVLQTDGVVPPAAQPKAVALT